MKGPRPRTPDEIAARFWSHVDRSGGGCWPWLSATRANGYGVFTVKKGEVVTAHRYAYFLTHSAMPPACACHSCDNRRCCRPDHIWSGTVADNHADMVAKGRQPKGDRHGRATLTEAAVREIKARLADGAVQRQLAKEYGVHPNAILYIAQGKTWRHIAGEAP